MLTASLQKSQSLHREDPTQGTVSLILANKTLVNQEGTWAEGDLEYRV